MNEGEVARGGRSAFVIAWIVALLGPMPAFGEPATATYRLTDLTPFSSCGGNAFCAQPWSINDAGQVTGTTASLTGFPAFRGDRNSTQLLDTLGGIFSLGWEINASGQVTGYSGAAPTGAYHAAFWDGTEVVDLGTLGRYESVGTAINDAGEVAGYVYGGGPSRAFFWDGVLQDLGTLGGDESSASDINADGLVVGGAQIEMFVLGDVYTFSHAFLWDGVTMQDLGTLYDDPDLGDDLGDSDASAINDAGQVAGNSDPTLRCITHGASTIVATSLPKGKTAVSGISMHTCCQLPNPSRFC